MAITIRFTPGAAARFTPQPPVRMMGDAPAGAVVVALAEESAGIPRDGGRTVILIGERPADPDAEAFAVLPADVPSSVLDAVIAAAVRAAEADLRAAAALGELDRTRVRHLELVRVGIALTAQRDLDRLLDLILTTARGLVIADAGSLYLVVENAGSSRLRFMLAQNDSVATEFEAVTLAVDETSIAGFVASSEAPLVIADVRARGADEGWRFNAEFDARTGYHTRSLMAVPIASRAGEILGVLQLINRKRSPEAVIHGEADADRFVLPFSDDDVELLQALAAQAAVAIENSRLVAEIEQLFEGFVRASVRAIEQRDPSTSGHSHRVAHYTMGLARAVMQNPPAAYRGFALDRDQWTQLRYAALLHDFGKVGVREAVLTKGRKLFPERLSLVIERFRHARRAEEVRLLRRLLEARVADGLNVTGDDLELLDERLDELRRSLDEQLAAVLIANEPTVLPGDTRATLEEIAGLVYPGEEGTALPLILPEELRALAVPKGSLDEQERREIESHVVHSYQFLLTIPWPRRFSRVPEIAYGHHEKLNGRGYPNRLLAEQIPPEVRMMTVCDIYDALAAGDRPYKRSVSPERAIEILEAEARDGYVDPELVRTFVAARVFARPVGDPST